MRSLLMMLIPLYAIIGCSDDNTVNGWDVRDFYPHKARSYVQTPDGHYRDAGPFSSVLKGFTTNIEIDNAVDSAFLKFAFDFPEFPAPSAKVDITDDYVMYVPNAGWAGGVSYGQSPIYVCLWTRGTSTSDPGAEFIKRAPDSNYPYWRFTTTPLLPAIEHELLHTIIGDPGHTSILWSRIH